MISFLIMVEHQQHLCYRLIESERNDILHVCILGFERTKIVIFENIHFSFIIRTFIIPSSAPFLNTYFSESFPKSFF
ncbi:hypothetical protein CQ022_18610 [Chryseobacterium culicis]|uniref:Uncharacterized protein n=1 Tax=Chryseobacterium culicis TaxID=680127 RepID=A0A2S9CMF8_CHRCI|nr:hypothetical protein CQ022_18610 [Chryseobacterium culicis]PRB88346.1 hypothetical protein CQ033_17505 [Chryseobacterium culicis]